MGMFQALLLIHYFGRFMVAKAVQNVPSATSTRRVQSWALGSRAGTRRGDVAQPSPPRDMLKQM